MKLEDITQDQFDEALKEIVGGMSATDLLAVPGVYEALSEEFNNEALDLVFAASEES